MADLRNTRLSTTAQNAAVNAVTALCNNGKLRIYNGSQPAAGGALSGQTMLWEGTFAASAFNSASSGSASLNGTLSNTIAASSTATWFRVLQSDSTTIVFDGSVGVNGADTYNLSLSNASLASGNTLTVNTFTFSVAAQGT